MKSSRARLDGQLSLPPAPLQNLSSGREPRKKVSDAPDLADVEAAKLLDEALTAARISSTEVHLLLGVSESLISKWRSPHYRECPSFVQLLRLPVSFHLAMHRAMDRRHGFGRAAVARLLDAAGELALLTEAR